MLFRSIISDLFGPLDRKYNHKTCTLTHPYFEQDIWTILENKLIDDEMIRILKKMLQVNPKDRCTIQDIVNDPYFRSVKKRIDLPIISHQDPVCFLQKSSYPKTRYKNRKEMIKSLQIKLEDICFITDINYPSYLVISKYIQY